MVFKLRSKEIGFGVMVEGTKQTTSRHMATSLYIVLLTLQQTLMHRPGAYMDLDQVRSPPKSGSEGEIITTLDVIHVSLLRTTITALR